MKSSDKNTQMWLNQENLTTNIKHVKDMPGNLNTNKISQNALKVMHQELDSQRGNHHELPFVALVNRLIGQN